jgi:outer membrane protein TolC
MLLLLLSLVSAAPDTLELSLGQAIDVALKHSPAATQASVSKVTSGIRVGQGVNALLPSANGALEYGQSTTKTALGDTTSKGWTGSLTINQVVFDPQVFAGVATSFVNAAYYAYDARNKEAQLIYDVTQGYLGLLGSRLLRDASASALDRANDNLRLNQEKLRLGAASKIDVMRSEVAQSQAKITLLQANNALATANAAFLATAGISDNVTVKPTEAMAEPAPLVVDDPDKLLAEIETSNPSAKLARDANTIATLNTIGTIVQILPSVSVFWRSQYPGSTMPAPEMPKSIKAWDDNDVVTTGIGLNFPLLDLKAFALDIASAINGSRQARAAALSATYQLRAAATTAILSYQETQQRYEYAKANLDLNQELYRLATEQQRLGAISLIDFFSVETALEQANATYITALTDTYVQAAQISYLLGRTRPQTR